MENTIETPAQVDFIANGAGMGETASRFLQMGCNAAALRPFIGEDGKPYISAMNSKGELESFACNAATLRRDEWKQIDDATLEAAQIRTGGIGDLEAMGLTFNITNGLGTTVLEYDKESDVEDADMTMDAVTRASKDRPQYTTAYLPLPVIFKDFTYTARVLAASRTRGQSLDTRSTKLATIKIKQKLESLLFTGSSSYAFGGGTIYGYMDAPNKNTVSLATNWDDSSMTGAKIVADVLAMKQASIGAKHYGPWMLYVPTGYETKLDNDHTTGYPKTIRSRILEIDGIKGVRVSDSLTANNVLLVQMTSDVIRLVKGLPITPVQWSTEGNMVFNFKIMTIQVPQVFSDVEGNSGITLLA